MIKKLLLFICLVILTYQIACTPDNDKELAIRVENTSIYNYVDVAVEAGGETHHFGNISSKRSSEYQIFNFAYRYAFIELQIEEKIYTLQPIDYVGERKLDPGDYTYEVNVHDLEEQYGSLSISLKKD